MELVLIPSGDFMMGSGISAEALAQEYQTKADHFTDERPQHRVRISRPFYLGKYEVTQSQWQAVTGKAPWSGSSFAKANPRHAASWVSWDASQTLVGALKSTTGVAHFALPTEAQWEYACRAGTTTRFSFGADASKLGQYAWFWDNAYGIGEKYVHGVGMKKPNPWGLYDMHGNVYEWCADWYDEDYYKSSPAADPEGPPLARFRVLRGGSWGNNGWVCRSAVRDWYFPVSAVNGSGFRVSLRVP